MRGAISADALDQIFRSARSYQGWKSDPIEESTLRELYEILKWGPTSTNQCPARFVWVRTRESKAKLAELAKEGNRAKIIAAPVTVIIGNDLDFADKLPQLFPHNFEVMQKLYSAPALAAESAMRNGTLQGAYFIIAARALGLDCGPMSGFDNDAVDEAFFAGTNIQSNFICSIGTGDPNSIFPRSPRLSFEEAGWFA